MKSESGFSLAMASLPFRKSQLAKLAIIVPWRQQEEKVWVYSGVEGGEGGAWTNLSDDSYFYRTRVRSLGMLVTNSLTP